MNRRAWVRAVIDARAPLAARADQRHAEGATTDTAEGGCGVIGLACDEAVAGRHLLRSLEQMRNRGNGKGGGVAACGLVPEELGVTREILEEDHLLMVAYLDPRARDEVEAEVIEPAYEIDHVREPPRRQDPELVEAMETEPPLVVQYFVRPSPDAVERFAEAHGLADAPRHEVEEEFVYQTSFRLNLSFYSATGQARAFVLSHGKDLMVFKAVAYADDVFRYYQLEDLHAQVWIGHHRYPTKGKVWHPGGAHPFIGLHEALVHNGDFANYHAVSEVLAQRNIRPLFLTDTEVSVLVFDLLHRTYGYPLEYVIETLAPTTERDFTQLPPDKQAVYRALQETHIHGSPDGPWFFLIAQSLPARDRGPGPVHRLLGITDTSMLRPQVFALQDTGGDGPRLGLAASEKQGIDAALGSLAQEDPRFWPRADRYWNARGGSHTDGGAFLFTVETRADGRRRLVCTDKFGDEIGVDTGKRPLHGSNGAQGGTDAETPVRIGPGATADDLHQRASQTLTGWTQAQVHAFLDALVLDARQGGPQARLRAFETLALLMDRRYATGPHRRSSLLARVDEALDRLVQIVADDPRDELVHVAADVTDPTTITQGATVVLDASGYPQEGSGSAARQIVSLVEAGAERVLVTRCRGHRFIGNGLGQTGEGIRLDVFGAPGDYLASGAQGLDIHVHGTGQDQLAQIMQSGRLVVHGDVGQAFMYGAEGGEAYVLGDAAGRPLINAVGHPKVVINGTALDYLGESFMAGDPHKGGGFVVLNGVELDDQGRLRELESPYPGGNLFSLASGGALFVRDPRQHLGEDQLNGGVFEAFTDHDWELIRPYLESNQALLGVPVDALLEVDGRRRQPDEVYRKVVPGRVEALQAEEAWVREAQG